MAIEIDGKTYRNLPEQVEENANNIQSLLATIASMGNVMRYKGSVATYADLPVDGNQVGDVYNILDTGNNYAWDGTAWDELSSVVDLTGYVQKTAIASTYDETSTYAVGDVVFYEDKLYRCTTAVGTPEAWDSTKWTQIAIGDDYVDLTSAQTISGVKTFISKINLKNNSNSSDNATWNLYANTDYVFEIRRGTLNLLRLATQAITSYMHFMPTNNGQLDLGDSTHNWKDLYLSNAVNFNGTNNRIESPNASFLDIYQGNSRRFAVGLTTYAYCHFVPSGARDLGSSTLLWKDLYLSGVISDGTNSVTVADLAWKELDLTGATLTETVVTSGLYNYLITLDASVTIPTGIKELSVDLDNGSAIYCGARLAYGNKTIAFVVAGIITGATIGRFKIYYR